MRNLETAIHFTKNQAPMRSLLIAPLLLLYAATLSAAPLTPAARSEIDALLSSLETSGCQFNRNGSWYVAAEAKSHLLRKLKYLEDKNLVQSTEQFVELAASTSSSSGKPYSVKCLNAEPMESKQWLSAQLSKMRSSSR